MKIYSNKNVLEEARERVSYFFDEFENIVVGFSGGKDSTVIFNLALEEAKKRNRLPLKVLWIDQEVEWQGTADFVEEIMTMREVEPYWFQMPMVISNNASSFNRFSYCWNQKEKEKWVRNKHPISKKENKYGTDRFHELFEAIFKVEFKGIKSCYLSGVRTEEAPKRFVGLTQRAGYKHITWTKRLSKKDEHYTFYPIYDWSYKDVWKFIYENKIKYNRVYDEMYRNGIKLNDMRISNLHHETSIQTLLLVQEIEPDTWEKVVDRIDGASSIKHIKKESFKCPNKLPFMFKDWEEYAYHLLENIIQEEKNKNDLRKIIKKKVKIYTGQKIKELFFKSVINTILSSDWDYTKIKNFELRPDVYSYRKYKKGKIDEKILKNLRLFSYEELLDLKNKLNEQKNKRSDKTRVQ